MTRPTLPNGSTLCCGAQTTFSDDAECCESCDQEVDGRLTVDPAPQVRKLVVLAERHGLTWSVDEHQAPITQAFDDGSERVTQQPVFQFGVAWNVRVTALAAWARNPWTGNFYCAVGPSVRLDTSSQIESDLADAVGLLPPGVEWDISQTTLRQWMDDGPQMVEERLEQWHREMEARK